ncbi:bacteriocin immunity protein [Pseudomonas indica]|uniref:bacteriocin immunity protein n=2 Tax=Pseudomonas indica TaxID=137658 RepID=UPI0009FBC74C|nr:bacteriocin immunity protein [Pseudomonas indica]MBU3055896.1 bacteriocin immunity protein [Pseudomonas indica]
MKMDFLEKQRFEDFTEQEFLLFIKEFFEETNDLEGVELEGYLDSLALHFGVIAGHPAGYGLLSHPTRYGVKDSPEAVLQAVKEWRQANGLPGFKQ